MLKEFDFDNLANRMLKIMRHDPKSFAEWARQIGFGEMQFRRFIKREQRTLHLKSALNLEKFLETKEKEYDL